MRAFLKGLDFDKETIDTIMARHGQLVTGYKEELETAKSSLFELKSELKTAKDAVSNSEANKAKYETELEDYKAKYETELAAHSATKTTHKTEKALSTKKSLVETKLTEAGVNPKAIKLLVKEIALDKLKDDGSNWDELHNPIKEAFSDFYGTKKTKGLDVATPPNGDNFTSYTMEQIKQMTPAQINENWDKGVKQTLQGGK